MWEKVIEFLENHDKRFDKKIKRLFRRTFSNLKNLCRWFPVIWRDKDWDYCYLLDVMEFKLKNMEDFFLDGKNTFSLRKDTLRVAKQLKMARLLVKRIAEDDYIDLLSFEGTIWGTKPNYREEEKYLFNQDMELLFKIFKKYLRSWWD